MSLIILLVTFLAAAWLIYGLKTKKIEIVESNAFSDYLAKQDKSQNEALGGCLVFFAAIIGYPLFFYLLLLLFRFIFHFIAY